MAIEVSIPDALRNMRAPDSVMLAGAGMMIQIYPAQEYSKPVMASDLDSVREELINNGEPQESVELMASLISQQRKRGQLQISLIRLTEVSGLKYDFNDATGVQVVHYVLRVPGGHVTVMATAMGGVVDTELVESFLGSIRIT